MSDRRHRRADVLPQHRPPDDDDRRGCDPKQRYEAPVSPDLRNARGKRNHLRIVEARFHILESAVYIDFRRFLTCYVREDRLQQPYDLDTMGITFHPPLCRLSLGGTGFTGEVSCDTFPIIWGDVRGTLVPFRHIH